MSELVWEEFFWIPLTSLGTNFTAAVTDFEIAAGGNRIMALMGAENHSADFSGFTRFEQTNSLGTNMSNLQE